MAVTLGELAVHARISTDDTVPVPQPYRGMLERMQRVAAIQIESWAEDAPEEMQDSATIAYVSYNFDKPTASRGMSFANVFRFCGAQAMLAPWHELVSVVIE